MFCINELSSVLEAFIVYKSSFVLREQSKLMHTQSQIKFGTVYGLWQL